MRQRALAADQHARRDPSPAGRSTGPSCEDRAVAQHGLHAEHVIDGHAVLERVRAAGVGGHVAADRAGALARRVGGEVVAGAGQGLGRAGGWARPPRPRPSDCGGRSGQDPCSCGVSMTTHAAAGQRQAAAGQAGAGPAGDHRRAVPLAAASDHFGNLLASSAGRPTASGRRRSIVKASQS